MSMSSRIKAESSHESSPEPEVDPQVIKANLIKDPLTELISKELINFLNGETGQFHVKYFKADQLTTLLLNWIMDLFTRNMKSMYEETWGWKPKKKKKEMTDEAARYLILFNDLNEPLAFTHFRFDMDYGRTTLYCYEIQVETSVRSLGLGNHIMKCLEELAIQTKMSMLVLTVFKTNDKALRFFKHFGFVLDETSPLEEDKEYLYFIMSKKV